MASRCHKRPWSAQWSKLFQLVYIKISTLTFLSQGHQLMWNPHAPLEDPPGPHTCSQPVRLACQ